MCPLLRFTASSLQRTFHYFDSSLYHHSPVQRSSDHLSTSTSCFNPIHHSIFADLTPPPPPRRISTFPPLHPSVCPPVHVERSQPPPPPPRQPARRWVWVRVGDTLTSAYAAAVSPIPAPVPSPSRLRSVSARPVPARHCSLPF